MANNDMLHTCIQKFHTDLNNEIIRVVDNIKNQNGFPSLSYKLNDPVTVSEILEEVNIHINSKRKPPEIGDDTIYLNIAPLTLHTCRYSEKTSILINMINKNISSLFYKFFERLLIDIQQNVNNVRSISIQNNYICKQFFKRIKRVPLFKEIKIKEN